MKVTSKKLHNKRATPQQNKKAPTTSNSFATLNQLRKNETKPVNEVGSTSTTQVQSSMAQQHKLPLETFLNPPIPILKRKIVKQRAKKR